MSGLLSATLLALICLAEASPRLELGVRDGRATIDLRGLDADTLQRLARLDAEQLARLFRVEVAGTGDRPAMLGIYRVEGNLLRFEPRFALVPGLRYKASFRPATGKPIEAILVLPARQGKPPVITAVYPSGDRLPENWLRFYLHFSEPMTQGDSYRHLRLLDDRGQAVDLPFLELDQELWDPSGKRLTVFFDPGRVKRGLKPREEVGPALIENRRYTLVVDAAWKSTDGVPLKAAFRKSFLVTAPEDRPLDVKDWKLDLPAAGTREPLRVRFPRTMDHALLERLIRIQSDTNVPLAGSISTAQQETHWLFAPERPWQAGRHRLLVDTRLEDVSGNSVGRPFEIDLLRPVERKTRVETVEVPFTIAGQK